MDNFTGSNLVGHRVGEQMDEVAHAWNALLLKKEMPDDEEADDD